MGSIVLILGSNALLKHPLTHTHKHTVTHKGVTGNDAACDPVLKSIG